MELSEKASHALVGAEKLRLALMSAITLGPMSLGSQSYQIKSRVKSLGSLVDKIQIKRKSGKSDYDVQSIRDIVGLRILTLFQQDLVSLVENFVDFLVKFQNSPTEMFYGRHLNNAVEEVIVYKSSANGEVYDTIYKFLHGFFKVRGFKDEFVRLETKDTRYSSVHIVVLGQVFDGAEVKVIPIEFQLRTAFEDIWSEIQHQLIYKNPHLGGTPDDERRRIEGDRRLRNLKNFIDSCSENADDTFFVLKSENRVESLAASSSSAPSNLATIFVGLKNILPAESYHAVDRVMRLIQSTYQELIALNRKYEGSDLLKRFKEVLDELSKLNLAWRNKLSSEEDLADFVYCIDMERAAAKYWMGQILRSEGGQGSAADDGDTITKEARDFFEESRQIYFDVSSIAKYTNDPVLNFRIGGIYRLLGQIEVAIAYFEQALAGMGDEWKDRGTVFEILIPRHLAFLLYKQAENWQSANPNFQEATNGRLGMVAAGFAKRVISNLQRAFQVTADLDSRLISFGDLVYNNPKDEAAKAYNNALWYALEFVSIGGQSNDLIFHNNNGIIKFDIDYYERLYYHYPLAGISDIAAQILETCLKASIYFEDKSRGCLWYRELLRRTELTDSWLSLPQSSRSKIEATLRNAEACWDLKLDN